MEPATRVCNECGEHIYSQDGTYSSFLCAACERKYSFPEDFYLDPEEELPF